MFEAVEARTAGDLPQTTDPACTGPRAHTTMRRLTLEGIELLDAIDRAGSFSAAGVTLGKVTSTVSYAVGRLEADLGVALFHRRGPRVALTPAGRELLEQGRGLLQAADELARRVQRAAAGWESEIRIAIDSLIPPMMLSALLVKFTAESPSTRVQLMSEAMTGTWEALVDGRADLALAVGQPPAAGGLRTRILADIGFRFCVAPHHPLAAWTGVVPSAELRRHRHIVVSDSARRLTPRTVGLLPGQSVLAVPDMRTKYALQAAGLGVGFLPAAFVASALERGLLVEKAVEQPKPDDHVLLAWRTSQPGKGLKWWREALADPPVVPQFLARASRAWVSEY